MIHAVIIAGQSLVIGPSGGAVPAGIPLAEVPFWFTLLEDEPIATDFGPLDIGSPGNNRGGELVLGLSLYAQRIRSVVIKLGRGATFLTQWMLAFNGAFSEAFQEQLVASKTATEALYPGQTIKYHLIWNQGQSELASENSVPASLWGSRFPVFIGEIESALGLPASTLRPHVVLTSAAQESKPNLAALRAQQLLAIEATNGFAINMDDIPLTDGTHPDASGQNILGQRYFESLQEEINMGTLTSDARTALVNHFRNKGSYSPAATHYAHVRKNGSYFSGNGYAAVALSNNTTTWPNASGRAKSNGVAFTFPNPTGAWWLSSDAIVVEISDNATAGAGTILATHTLTSVPTIDGSTGPLTIPIGDIDLTAATGCFTDTVVHELLNLMFGAAANSPRATVYGTYFAGDPQGAGAETSATRTAITQATGWGAASAGLAISSAAIALADEADATHYAEYTASSGGALLFSAALPGTFTPPVGGIIPAGGLRTQLS